MSDIVKELILLSLNPVYTMCDNCKRYYSREEMVGFYSSRFNVTPSFSFSVNCLICRAPVTIARLILSEGEDIIEEISRIYAPIYIFKWDGTNKIIKTEHKNL